MTWDQFHWKEKDRLGLNKQKAREKKEDLFYFYLVLMVFCYFTLVGAIHVI